METLEDLKNKYFNEDGTYCVPTEQDARIALMYLATNAATAVVPGGDPTFVQFNSAGSFGGDSNFVWDNTDKKLGIGGAPSALASRLDVQIDASGNQNVVAIRNINATGGTLVDITSGTDAGNVTARCLRFLKDTTLQWAVGVPRNQGASNSGVFVISTNHSVTPSVGAEFIMNAAGNCSIGGRIAGVNFARLSVVGSDAAKQVMVLRAAASQSVNILEIQDSAAAILSRYTSNGNLIHTGSIGIGMTPSNRLDIDLAAAGDQGIRVTNTTAAGGSSIFLNKQSDAGNLRSCAIFLQNAGVTQWGIGAIRRGGSNNSNVFSIVTTSDTTAAGGGWFNMHTNGRICIGLSDLAATNNTIFNGSNATLAIHQQRDVAHINLELRSMVGQTGAQMRFLDSSGTLQLSVAANGRDFILDTATGTKIGTAAAQKLGFWNATPVVQHATTGEVTGFLQGAGLNARDGSTFTGNVGSSAYTIGDIVKCLKNAGFLAQ